MAAVAAPAVGAADADRVQLLYQGWSQWQPYIRSGDKRRGSQNRASLFTVTELKAGGFPETPAQFGIYALGILPPDIDVKHMTHDDVAIVNVGVAGDAPPSKNTLKGRLRSYATKVKPYEWALARWLDCGFSVWVKWKVMQAADEKAFATIEGAKQRKDAESLILKRFEFFLNTAEQAHLKGKGGSLRRDPDALPVPVREGRAQRCAGDFAPPSVLRLIDMRQQLQAIFKMQTVADMRTGIDAILRRLP